MKSKNIYKLALPSIVLGFAFAGTSHAQVVAVDPGVRGGAPGAGGVFPGLGGTVYDEFFDIGLDDFAEAEGVGDGVGPRFNLDNCGECHSQPAIGGTSPAVNPQIAAAVKDGAKNTIPSFLAANGPAREARFKRNADGSRDGGVHALFVVSGRKDPADAGGASAAGCTIVQENFQQQVNNNNIIFRIPTPVFGAGLIEVIPNSTLIANLTANGPTNQSLGISGRFNRNGNDGQISRFGWKAQNQSLLLFAGEAYNVEMGISNELFQIEREENANCQFAPFPNDTTSFAGGDETKDGVSAIEKFAFFMRFSAPPTPAPATASINRGRTNFINVGCAQCHTPTLRAGNSPTPGFSGAAANLFSDLAIHNMGPGLADDILQGNAGGDEFRTAPLWGVGQRIFFLHDGRTRDLRTAILAHRSNGNGQFPASEANAVVNRFDALNGPQTQDVFNFLRSL
jgi:CxxC motif-containing protein (DUF1111 family)